MFKSLVFSLLIVVSLLAEHSAAGHIEPEHNERCYVCGMMISNNPGWSAQIVFKDNLHLSFDGPKDMFRYYFNMSKYARGKTRDDISELFVKDYLSGEPIDALKALYVIKSRVFGPMGHEFIPFRDIKNAKGFAGERGGMVILFQNVTPAVLKAIEQGQQSKHHM